MTDLELLVRAETAIESAHSAMTRAGDAFRGLGMGMSYFDATETLDGIRTRIRQRMRGFR